MYYCNCTVNPYWAITTAALLNDNEFIPTTDFHNKTSLLGRYKTSTLPLRSSHSLPPCLALSHSSRAHSFSLYPHSPRRNAITVRRLDVVGVVDVVDSYGCD